MHRTSLTRLLTCILALPLVFPGTSSAAAPPDEPLEAPHPCFIEPPRWNIALDGPLPRC